MADFATSSHPAVQAQLDRLAMLSPAGDALGLERIAALLDRLGRPQDRLPPVFHVSGTNGKGSTCAFLRAALEGAGMTVHAFTSPHLVRFNERIRMAGALIDDDRLAELLTEVLDASSCIEPSFFEVTTAAAFLAFARTPADACVIEVGLGGRLDATNVIERPLVCGIASLGFDHAQFLGNRIAAIAGEKAGIAKRGVPLVTQLYHPAAAARVAEVAARVSAPWHSRGRAWNADVRGRSLRYRDANGALTLPLPGIAGRHQAMNAALAVAMLRHQDLLAVPESALAEGIRQADWPARLQRLQAGPLARLLPEGSELWVDGGHNPSAARAIAAHVRQWTRDRPLVLLFASLTTKDPRGTLSPFAGLAERVLTLPMPGHDSRDPQELAALARSLGSAAEASLTLQDALAEVSEPSNVLVFGSLYLAGEALRLNDQPPD